MTQLPAHYLQQIWDQIRMGLMILNSDFTVRAWNQFLADRSPVFGNDLTGRPFLQAFPEANTAFWHDMVNRVQETGKQVFVQWRENPYLISLPADNDPGSLMLQSVLLVPFRVSQGDGPELNHLCYALFIMDTTTAVKYDIRLEKALAGLNGKQQQLVQLSEALEQANNQLLQSEKLAGIGQLAAGVAHEINNPIGYVFSNLKTLAGYVEDLMQIVDAVEHVSSVEALKQIKQKLEYDYIQSDIRSLIGESEDGIDRVRRIIGALKDFSHIGEESFAPANLHQGIETTLNVVNNEIKYKADVTREFGELPEVECIASQINQVVMNLLVNASHAIEGFGCIAVRTGCTATEAWFEVEDTGAGMDEATQKRIFDPFFTTKPVGSGTGLGLALSYNIIKKHNGRIEVDSQKGRGTRFRVWLPLQQPQPQPDAVHES